MCHHGTYNRGHESTANEEGISVLESSVRLEIEYEIVIDPGVLPHEQVATIEEYVQAN
jgi:hypothetical protein